MRKIVSVILSFLLILSSAAVLFSMTASAQSLYIRKIVSVVYDDSDSMKGEKTAYANYAMQAFCGMLNSEDKLFISYMSGVRNDENYTPEQVDLSAGKIQASVNNIKAHGATKYSTPLKAVEIAFDKLRSVEDQNANTQYWLVVITDGSFNECKDLRKDKVAQSQFLTEKFESYSSTKMPNGSNPQITFMAIGSNVASPAENEAKGITTYRASNAEGIRDAMDKMADRVSGRTRLDTSDIKTVDSTTVQVSSSIPLLNIAVFFQDSQTAISKAVTDDGVGIPVIRNVSLSYDYKPEDDSKDSINLEGGAYLIGDSQNVINAGTYTLTFEQPVNSKDIVVLFEPALEMRMSVKLNDKEITDFSELDNAVEGDKISVACKIYEMGSEKEIDPSLMPAGTEYELIVSEDGNVVLSNNDKKLDLSEYTLKNVETELKASMKIERFSPISHSAKFTPTKYIPKTEYKIVQTYTSDEKSVKFDEISENKDMSLCFTVYADGEALTDPEAVKALSPQISVSPMGNGGKTVIDDNGRIIFTPDCANAGSVTNGSFNVEVVCSIEDGTSTTGVYTVLIAKYEVIASEVTDKIVKTGFYGNTVGASFYIAKDGVKLEKSIIENDTLSVFLNEEYSHLKTNIEVAEDGTVTVTPYSEEEHKLTFFNWWGNWYYYTKLPKADVNIVFSHSLGSAESTVEVIGETTPYVLLNVVLPAAIELTAIILLVIWIILVVTKPKFLEGSKLIVADLNYSTSEECHIISNFSEIDLTKFNKIKRGNGRLKPKLKADIVSAGGIKISADYAGRIICQMPIPWYYNTIEPYDDDISIKTPEALERYFETNTSLHIMEFSTRSSVVDEHDRIMLPACGIPKYNVVSEFEENIDGYRRIRRGIIFIYVR